jgi:hypothetical protein
VANIAASGPSAGRAAGLGAAGSWRAGSWELRAPELEAMLGSWELGAGSWELGAPCPMRLPAAWAVFPFLSTHTLPSLRSPCGM